MQKPNGMDNPAPVELEDIRLHIKDELVPDRKLKKKYCCPLCGSGTKGGDSDGAFRIMKDGIHGKCESCNFYGDLFDLVSQRDGTSLKEATKEMIKKYGTSARKLSSTATKPDRKTETQKEAKPVQSFSEYIKECHAKLKGSPAEEYLLKRGITEETMERFMLGYGMDQFNRPCVVIPHDRSGRYFCTRTLANDVDIKYLKPKGVNVTLFNALALRQNQPCFVVESQLCAISIAQEGGSALALGGIGNDGLLLPLLDKPPAAPLILALDNDPPKEDGTPGPGPTAQAKLAEALREKGITFLEINVSGECKDPNELLQKDPAALRQNIAAAVAVANATQKTIEQNELEDYEALTASASFQAFEDYLEAKGKKPPVPTGFTAFDNVLNGGLTGGLYIMGAVSSLGKTSWMLNIADNIAASGRDVIYYSLEMSQYELIAKSISRISFGLAGKREDSEAAFSTFEVLNSQGAAKLSQTRAAALQKAKQMYRETIGKHMWIVSEVGSIGTKRIMEDIEKHIRITGRDPVVFIDYLQILAPADPHSTDKQNTDRAVVDLKQASAKYDIPIFCISSLNRANYNEAINMAAFKESGAIEYGSDVLIGLQLHGLSRGEDETNKNTYQTRVSKLINSSNASLQVDIEVIVLKNRNGQRGGSGTIKFDKKYNSFTDVSAVFTISDITVPWQGDGWKVVED